MLSAAWLVRRWHIYDSHLLQYKFGFSEDVVSIVNRFVIEDQMTHDEFFKVLKEEILLEI